MYGGQERPSQATRLLLIEAGNWIRGSLRDCSLGKQRCTLLQAKSPTSSQMCRLVPRCLGLVMDLGARD